jgi:hypothetical protein
MSTEWLAQLAPEHAPAPPGWWPPAPGWWVSAAIAVTLAGVLIHWWRNPRRRLLRAALAELQMIRAQTVDAAATARALENLLRRYALAVFGAEATARLTGDAWLAFVGAHGGRVGAPAAADAWGRSLLAACFGGGGGAREGGPRTAADATPEDGPPTSADATRESWFRGAERFLRHAGRRHAGRPPGGSGGTGRVRGFNRRHGSRA